MIRRSGRRPSCWQRRIRCAFPAGRECRAESGVDTFRDESGYWSKFDPQELASREGFARDPQKVWAWYRERRQHLATVKPNAGHTLLAEWETRMDEFVVVTQNIDGLHHVAGSRNIIELPRPPRQRQVHVLRLTASRISMTSAPSRTARCARSGYGPTWCGSARCCPSPRWPPRSKRHNVVTSSS